MREGRKREGRKRGRNRGKRGGEITSLITGSRFFDISNTSTVALRKCGWKFKSLKACPSSPG